MTDAQRLANQEQTITKLRGQIMKQAGQITKLKKRCDIQQRIINNAKPPSARERAERLFKGVM